MNGITAWGTQLRTQLIGQLFFLFYFHWIINSTTTMNGITAWGTQLRTQLIGQIFFYFIFIG